LSGTADEKLNADIASDREKILHKKEEM